jgi:hypothetical protein
VAAPRPAVAIAAGSIEGVGRAVDLLPAVGVVPPGVPAEGSAGAPAAAVPPMALLDVAGTTRTVAVISGWNAHK